MLIEVADKVVKTASTNMSRNLKETTNIMRREMDDSKENKMEPRKLKSITPTIKKLEGRA